MQSTLWFASSCIVGVVAFFVYPRESSPQIVLATLQLLFFLMSALNHAYETVSHGNWRWQNVNRPLLSAAMVAGAVSRQQQDLVLASSPLALKRARNAKPIRTPTCPSKIPHGLTGVQVLRLLHPTRFTGFD